MLCFGRMPGTSDKTIYCSWSSNLGGTRSSGELSKGCFSVSAVTKRLSVELRLQIDLS